MQILLAAAVLYLLLKPSPNTVSRFTQGQISPVTIVAPFEFQYIDVAKRTALEDEVRSGVSPIFNSDEDLPSFWVKSIEDLLNAARDSAGKADLGEEERIRQIKDSFQNEYGFSDEEWKALLRITEGEEFRQLLLTLAGKIPRYIVGNEAERELFATRGQVRILNRNGSSGTAKGLEVLTIDQLKENLRSESANLLSGPDKIVERDLGMKILDFTVQKPTLVFDKTATELEESKAVKAIEPSAYHAEVRPNEVIVPKGEEIGGESWEKIRTVNNILSKRALGPHIGTAFFALAFWIGVTAYLRRYHAAQAHESRFFFVLLALCSAIFLGAWGLEKISLRLGSTYRDIGYLLPVATIGMLLSALIDGRLAAIMVCTCAIPAGLILGNRMDLTIVYFLTGIVAAGSVVGISKWSDFYRAGVSVSITAVGTYLGLYFMQTPYQSMVLDVSPSFLKGLLCAGVSGIIATAGALFLLHLLEKFLDITTNLKLLEYSFRNKILRELDKEAPGTYQHSLQVSAIAEAAADTIGANPLICRVASLYHDVGKLRKPQYFSENQATQNEKKIHAKLSPNLSCLLIRNHVKDGVETAERERLPKLIIDVIEQHHGTTLISYFYEKALTENPGGEIKESDFRYPGPKPQTIECAIVMLADSIEASSRSLTATGPGDIQLLVRKVINNKFMDGQFDECDVTLKSLRELSDSFTNSLYSLLHRRVSYPKEQEDRTVDKPFKTRPEPADDVVVSEGENL